MAVLGGAFVLGRDDGVTGPVPTSVPTMRTTPSPTPVPSILPPVGTPQPSPAGRIAPPPTTTACTVIIPSSVTKVNGRGRYSDIGPGDVICLPAGERANIKFFNIHGGPGQPVIIRNEGGVVRITGLANKMGGIGLVRSSWVRVTGSGISSRCGAGIAPREQRCGIVIADAYNGVRVAANGSPRRIEIDHVRVERTSRLNHSTGISIHPEAGETTSNEGQTISGFFVHHNYLVDIYREGMYIGSEPHGPYSAQRGKLVNVDISHNLVQRTGYDGIKVKVAVRNVAVHDNVVLSPALDEFAKHETGIQLATSTGDVYNNLVSGGVEGIASGRPLPGAVTRFFNNIVIGPSHEAFITSEDGAQIYNNTIVGAGTGGILAKGNESGAFDNIIAGSLGLPVSGQLATNVNNLVGTVPSMRFIAPERGDYRPRATSPAVDRGAATGVYPPFDASHLERPQGSRPDVGAFEYDAP
jgi:hypothetical protein